MRTIESIIKSPRSDLQKINMLKGSFELYVKEYNEKLVNGGHINCPYDDNGYGECKFGWHDREQTCEECLLEWIKMQ